MSAVSGVNIAMLPEEHVEFWAFLATTGDIWARALGDTPRDCRYPPAPAAQFVKRFARKIQHYDAVDVYLGLEKAVLEPRTYTQTETVGGKKVRRRHVDPAGSELIRYAYGVITKDKVMERTVASYYSSYLRDNEFVRHREEFLKWAKKVMAWLRRRIAGKVPVYRCNYELSASALVMDAVEKGLKVV
jgi:hypothetical protein